MLVSIKHRTSLLGAQADGQTLTCSLGHWGDQEQGVDSCPFVGAEAPLGVRWTEKLSSTRGTVDGGTHGSGVRCGISLPQHLKLAVLIPRCSWNKRGMWYLRVVSSTLCNSCLKADCIKYPVDGVGFVFALKWINLDSHTRITVLILPHWWAFMCSLEMELIFSYVL